MGQKSDKVGWEDGGRGPSQTDHSGFGRDPDVWQQQSDGRREGEDHPQPQPPSPTDLILQMKDLREPMHILMEDCCPSFLTVPVFRSRIRPK